MKKLPKKHEARNITPVTIEGEQVEISNLYVGAVMNQANILIKRDDKWHQINLPGIGINYVNIRFIADLIEREKLTFSFFGLNAPAAKKYDIRNIEEDYDWLNNFYPQYSVEDIYKLHSYMEKYGRKTPFTELKSALKQITENNETIDSFITKCQIETDKILNKHNMSEHVKLRESRLKAMGLEYNNADDTYNGFGFSVSGNQIETYEVDEWESLLESITEASIPSLENYNETAGAIHEATQYPAIIENVPEPETQPVALTDTEREIALSGTETTEAKKPLSIEAFGRLTADRIKELQGLKESQELAVNQNPFVKITDAKTLKAAKAAKAALLKSSTSTEAIETNATKYLNSFKNMLKNAILPLAKITRDAHDKQATEIKKWEDAEKMRKEKEEREALEKIKKRTDSLFAVPFTFNGTIYSIGTIYVTPSQIENATDEEFQLLVKQGEAIKIIQDNAEKERIRLEAEQADKDKIIADLQAKLAALTSPETTATAPAESKQEPVINTAAPVTAPEAAPVNTPPVNTSPVQNQPAAHTQQPATNQAARRNIDPRYVPSDKFVMAAPENELLNKFDLSHIELLNAEPINPNFVKAREYYKFGTRDFAERVIQIIDAPKQEGVLKSNLIYQLAVNSMK